MFEQPPNLLCNFWNWFSSKTNTDEMHWLSQCSGECQKLDWSRHRQECGLSQIGPQSALTHPLASEIQERNTQDYGKVPNAGVCPKCNGTGLTYSESSPSFSLPRLEGIMPGCIIRQKNCPTCSGEGLIFPESIPKHCGKSRPSCHVCQAYGGEPCTCGHSL